jgi:hypothetical protein
LANSSRTVWRSPRVKLSAELYCLTPAPLHNPVVDARSIPAVPDDLNALRDYLKQNPSFIESIRRSSQNMLEQYRLAESAMASIAKQTEQIRQSTLEAFRTAQLPFDTWKKFREQMSAIFPANWRGISFDLDRIQEVLQSDGIPIVHVPRASIVTTILGAEDYEARVQIIQENLDDIAADCEKALDAEFDSWFDQHAPLARRAVQAYRAGHYEAAQALAVNLCDTYFKKFLVGKTYPQMVESITIEQANSGSMALAFNVLYALVPGVPFLTPWWPSGEAEPPTTFSRHVSIHFANVDQMTQVNATIAIMFVTSLTVAIDFAAKRAARSSNEAIRNG